MRPLLPVPLTCVRSTPSSRANLRTDGLACARAKPARRWVPPSRDAMPAPRVQARSALARRGCAASPLGGGLCSRRFGSGLCWLRRRGGSRGRRPQASLQFRPAPAVSGACCRFAFGFRFDHGDQVALRDARPTCSFISRTTPATVDGTSIVAFSVSSVISGLSSAIVSPGLTSTSMTSTSL